MDRVFQVTIDGAIYWRCEVAGRVFGDWVTRGAALAGFETEKRRAYGGEK